VYTKPDIVFRIRPDISNGQLNQLHAQGFEHAVVDHDWQSQLSRSLLWVGAFHRERLVGFVNVAWDGGVHAFLLDTAVDVSYRRRGIGTRLVREAIAGLRRHGGIEWLHVDSDPELMKEFYFAAGFSPTAAGVVRVDEPAPQSEYAHTDVRREGDVVVRSAKPQTPYVHALLRHLEDVAFRGAPRVVGSGFDADGNETLTWIEGESPRHGLETIEAAAALGVLLRELHEATATFRPPDGVECKPDPCREVGDPRVVGHCDNGFWNIVLRDGMPVAFIDFDFAGPIDPRLEVAMTAQSSCNLYSDDIIEMHGLEPLHFRLRQYRAFVDGYGLTGADREGLVDLMVENFVRTMESDSLEANVTPETKESDALWGLAWQARTAAWLLRNRTTLEDALR
jgi:GNAT superfamily N-acetyltransferase